MTLAGEPRSNRILEMSRLRTGVSYLGGRCSIGDLVPALLLAETCRLEPAVRLAFTARVGMAIDLCFASRPDRQRSIGSLPFGFRPVTITR